MGMIGVIDHSGRFWSFEDAQAYGFDYQGLPPVYEPLPINETSGNMNADEGDSK